MCTSRICKKLKPVKIIHLSLFGLYLSMAPNDFSSGQGIIFITYKLFYHSIIPKILLIITGRCRGQPGPAAGSTYHWQTYMFVYCA
jgi:hypothetical protein